MGARLSREEEATAQQSCFVADGRADLAWQAPAAPLPCCGAARAARSFSAGDLVELSACIPTLAGPLSASFLGDYCHSCPGGQDSVELTLGGGLELRLLPTGWALLFGRGGADPNLVAEHQVHVPPAKEGCDARKQELAVQHWLAFRATREIAVGEDLVSQGDAGCHPLPPVFAAALQSVGVAELPQDEVPLCALTLSRSVTSNASPGSSPVHGIGVFASRALSEGEVIERAPMMPLLYREIARTPLREYVSLCQHIPHLKADEVVLFPCGMGALYNHSAEPNVSLRRCEENPYIMDWVAAQDICDGAELFISYGGDYWNAAWRAQSA